MATGLSDKIITLVVMGNPQGEVTSRELSHTRGGDKWGKSESASKMVSSFQCNTENYVDVPFLPSSDINK